MIAYVILHYQNISITKQCVESVLSNNNQAQIVIVDNASPNKSGEALSHIYSSKPNVNVIINKSNQGFAKGNNLGYRYAKQIGATIIVVMNNDIVLGNDFEISLLKILEEDIDILGPDIHTPDGNHQNPLSISKLSSPKIIKEIVMNYLKMIYLSNKSLFRKYISKKNNKVKKNEWFSNNCNDCILHGSILIFGDRFVKNENFAFLPYTFMYGEEFILGDYAKKRGYKIAYRNNIHILHLGGASTKIDSDMQSKVLFRFKNTTKSLIIQLILRIIPLNMVKKL